MSLPAVAHTHHTMWLDLPGGHTVSVRYASDGHHLFCFGDDCLSGVRPGTHLTAALRNRACGRVVSYFWVRVEEVPHDEVRDGLLADLLGHGPLVRGGEVSRSLKTIRSTRRLLMLVG